MTETIAATDYYYLVVQGFAQEFFPHVAFRKESGFPEERRKNIKCPYCGRNLLSIDASTKLELYRCPKKPERMVNCHEYRKCRACHETIGVYFAPG